MYYVIMIASILAFAFFAVFSFRFYPSLAKQLDDAPQGEAPKWRSAISTDGRWYSSPVGLLNARVTGVLASIVALGLCYSLAVSVSRDFGHVLWKQ